jgi:hypothetical protein
MQQEMELCFDEELGKILSPEEIVYVSLVVEEPESLDFDFYLSTAFDKLYNYFVFETFQMPYGTAKARTGDPVLWIMNRLEKMKKKNL